MEDDKKPLENAEIVFENAKSNLDELKDVYSKLSKEVSLPDFDVLNKDFGIEKIQVDETDFLVREIRRYVADKFSSYLRLIESILQPSNSQMFVFMMIKSLSSSDMELLQGIYKRMARKEIEIIELDLEFDFDREVFFVNSANEMWQDIKKELFSIVDKVKLNWDSESPSLRESRNYYM